MDILKALEPTGKATIKGCHANEYAYTDEDGILRWMMGEDVCSLSLLLSNLWQPYHEKPEIRPETAGELWKCRDGRMAFIHGTISSSTDLRITAGNGVSKPYGSMEWHQELLHKGLHGWTRIEPPVPDENVEEVVIEGVRWKKQDLKNPALACIVPCWDANNNIHEIPVPSLIDKPPMKMTLEWGKEVPDE